MRTVTVGREMVRYVLLNKGKQANELSQVKLHCQIGLGENLHYLFTKAGDKRKIEKMENS